MVFSSFLQGPAGASPFQGVREPIYAGSWYPGTTDRLTQTIDSYIESAANPLLDGPVVGIVAPHAGYVYSGEVAAHAYKSVKGNSYELVVIMGNAHREMFHGAAIDGVKAYSNCLGSVNVDIDLGEQLDGLCTSVSINSKPHQKEHSLELQLPFLQRALSPGFKILPILFGIQSEQARKEILGSLPELLKNKSCLLVSSTDLTHYPTYSDAKSIDTQTIEFIAAMDCDGLQRFESTQLQKNTTNLACVLCAGTATRCVMALSQALGADTGTILKYANSGDVSVADRNQVVGYGAIALCNADVNNSLNKASKDRLSIEEQQFLLKFSRRTLTEYVKSKKSPDLDRSQRISQIQRGAFVTLHKAGHLRGCIGYIEPFTNCMEAVRDNTISAAVKDPRFPRVTPEELDDIDIEISVLTPPVKIDSWKEIQIGIHGIVLEKGIHKSVFLPQVAPEQGWDLETTLMYLALKAGLPADGWEDASFKVFEAQVFNEKELMES